MGHVLGIVYRCIATHLIKKAGFSLHAGVATRADQRQRLERLCRYISRPAISEKRLSLTPNGNVRYQLKTPYREGKMRVMLLRASFWLFKIASGDIGVACPQNRREGDECIQGV